MHESGVRTVQKVFQARLDRCIEHRVHSKSRPTGFLMKREVWRLFKRRLFRERKPDITILLHTRIGIYANSRRRSRAIDACRYFLHNAINAVTPTMVWTLQQTIGNDAAGQWCVSMCTAINKQTGSAISVPKSD